MTILAAAADVFSWMTLMGILPTEANSSATATTYADDTIELGNKLLKPINITTLNESEIFMVLSLSSANMYDNNTASTGLLSSKHKAFFCLRNQNNKPIIGFGWTPSGTYMADGNVFNITIFDGLTTTPTDVSSTPLTTKFPMNGAGSTTIQTVHDKWIFHVKFDNADNTQSFVKVYKNGINVGQVTGAALHAGSTTGINNITIGEFVTASATNPYVRIRASSLIVSNVADFSLKAYPLKPGAFTANNQFSGVVANIAAWIQDLNTVATAAEVNTVCEFTLTRPTATKGKAGVQLTVGQHICKKLDIYSLVRYVQAGGVNCTFAFALYNGATKITDDFIFTCTANEDDTKFLVRKITSYINDITTGVAIGANALSNLVGRITLVGV